MKIVAYTFLPLLLSLLLGCGKGENDSSSPVNQGQRNAVSLSGKTENPISHTRKVLSQKDVLAAAIADAKKRIRLGLTWAWAPARTDEKRFPHFIKSNQSRWNLELNMSMIPSGTMYEQTSSTEEGGSVSEYLFFADGKTTWWFDGRGDEFSEFKNPPVRRQKVSKLFLAIHDGQSGWVPVAEKKEMPLDHGLAIGIQLEDGSQRYW